MFIVHIRYRWMKSRSGVRILFDDNKVMQLSYQFQNIVRISSSSKFWKYHTIFDYQKILAKFSLLWICKNQNNLIIVWCYDIYQHKLMYFLQFFYSWVIYVNCMSITLAFYAFCANVLIKLAPKEYCVISYQFTKYCVDLKIIAHGWFRLSNARASSWPEAFGL